MGHPTVYPTGVTLYDPVRAWNGYTIVPAARAGALLIDMNGREVQLWQGLQGSPYKLLPEGHLMGSTGRRDPKYGIPDQEDLAQVDWNGRIVWQFNRFQRIEDPSTEARWVARQHHDYQREGNPVGYYSPNQAPLLDRGKTLLLVHKEVRNPAISDQVLLDDTFLEVDWDGTITWSWNAHEHFDELGFDTDARTSLSRNPNMRRSGSEKVGDWLHTNSISLVGPNRHYDAGDERFHPENIIWDAREANIIAITDKKMGRIVWRLGPDYSGSEALRKLGWIIGQHHAHIIPRGLPGEGNVLVFDNGGWAGYGAPNPTSPTGMLAAMRDYSRVLEIDPITLEIVWQFTPSEAGFVVPLDAARFYSPLISSAQRLPNGNTLITEGTNGRVFEVTPDHKVVWEYVSPYWDTWGGRLVANTIYRAYRAPYEWVPRLDAPKEAAILPPDARVFRVPGAALPGCAREVMVHGAESDHFPAAYCVDSR